MAKPDPDTVGVLLAGGRSSRMGSNKALLPWCGRPLIEHMQSVLVAAGVGDLKISGELAGYAGIPDLQAGLGPLGGLASVAATLADGELLVLPVDMPRITPALLRRLLATPLQRPCRRFEGMVLPLRMRVDTTTRQVLAGILAEANSSRSLRNLQARLGVEELPITSDEKRLLINCNTPQEWEAIQQ